MISTGTFLGGETHIGMDTTPFGRIGEPAAFSLSRSLREAGFRLGRLKTGTPPRLRKDTIRFEGLGAQEGDLPAKPFSFLTHKVENEVSTAGPLSPYRADPGSRIVRTTKFNVSRPPPMSDLTRS